MAFEFTLPDIGEGVTEGEVVKWLVGEGESVGEDQPIVEIMTDKATVEIASPKTGKIEALLAKEGDVVPVGTALVRIAEGKGASPAPKTKAAKTPSSPPPPAAEPAGDTPLFSASVAPSRPEIPRPMAPAVARSAFSASGKILASPATRKMARDMGVDIRALHGSGPGGRILKHDLQSFGAGAIQAGAPQMAGPIIQVPIPMKTPSKIVEFGKRKPSQPKSGEERVALRGIRKKIAEHMALSKRTAAHFTHVDQVDMTELVRLRETYKTTSGGQIKLTYLPFIVKAVCVALREFPAMNALLDEKTNEIVLKHFYNVGIAVATGSDDLVVPVIKDADQKSVLQLAQAIEAIGKKARTGKLDLADVQGGTFTITSLGNLGGVLATPIINYPEVGILGFHKITDQVVVREGQIVVRKMAYMSLSLDHRVVDGAVAASFMNMVIRNLEQPGLLSLDG